MQFRVSYSLSLSLHDFHSVRKQYWQRKVAVKFWWMQSCQYYEIVINQMSGSHLVGFCFADVGSELSQAIVVLHLQLYLQDWLAPRLGIFYVQCLMHLHLHINLYLCSYFFLVHPWFEFRYIFLFELYYNMSGSSLYSLFQWHP